MNNSFDGSHDGKYSKFVPENYIGFKLACVVVVLMAVFAALVFAGVIK